MPAPAAAGSSCSRPQDHERADLLAVWSGRSGDDHAGQPDRAAFGAIAQGCPAGGGLPLPPWPMSIGSQLTITTQDVFQRPRWQAPRGRRGHRARQDQPPWRASRTCAPRGRRDTRPLRLRAPGEPVHPARHSDDPPRGRAGPSQSRPDHIAPRTGGRPMPRVAPRGSVKFGYPGDK